LAEAAAGIAGGTCPGSTAATGWATNPDGDSLTIDGEFWTNVI
jgi:hypothetical protein